MIYTSRYTNNGLSLFPKIKFAQSFCHKNSRSVNYAYETFQDMKHSQNFSTFVLRCSHYRGPKKYSVELNA